MNAIGDVVVGCDWSYESQKKYRIGNVMDEKWLETFVAANCASKKTAKK